MTSALHAALRLFLPGTHSAFSFERRQPVLPDRPESVNLYIHLPFCSSICPFCPYVKELYEPAFAAAYQQAILKELEGYRELWGGISVESVYFGGGTPSLTPEIVETTLNWISRHFQSGREVGVEIHPSSAGDAVLHTLKGAGVTQASLGVQTFNDRLLGVLGRGYSGNLAVQACERVLQVGFETVDVDLMFAIPTQTLEEVEADVETAIRLGVHQLSAYPLIPFSYTPLKSHLNARGLCLPSRRLEKRMLQSVVTQARNAGYERSSIWSFNRPGSSRYTTVTRDAFVGIGAGATSRLGDYFWLNTFSVVEYIKAMENGSPRSLATRLTSADRMAYWLFWQCYNLSVDTAACRSVCGTNLPRRVNAMLPLLGLLGITRREGDIVRFTDRGAYLFHLVEKKYTQSYLRPMWEACLAEPWPERVVL